MTDVRKTREWTVVPLASDGDAQTLKCPSCSCALVSGESAYQVGPRYYCSTTCWKMHGDEMMAEDLEDR